MLIFWVNPPCRACVREGTDRIMNGIDAIMRSKEQFRVEAMFDLVANPSMKPSEIGTLEEWGVNRAFLNIADAWHSTQGNNQMSVMLTMLNATLLDNPDDALIPLTGFKMWEASHPVNPLKINVDIDNLPRAIELVGEWNAVSNEVWYAVWDAVWYAVGNEVWYEVWNAVRNAVSYDVRYAVGNAVGNAIWAYTATLFPSIPELEKYKCIETLYKMGFIPSCDKDKVWRLHIGKEAKIIWEGKL
jgi:hypothetical protein